MCGAIVLAYSSQRGGTIAVQSNTRSFFLHLAYNAGRILSYALLGAVVGYVGMTIGWFEEAGEYFSVIGGIIMVVAGIAMLGIIPISPRLSLLGSNKSVSKVHGELLIERTVGSKLALGFLTPLLPCGILYAMLAKAATTGNALNGAMTMGLFAIGMAPALILLGGVSSFFSTRMRKGAEQIAAVMIILMGLILILRGFHVPYLSWMSGETKCSKCAS